MVKEEAGEIKAPVFLCNQNRIEEHKRVSRNISRMEDKTKGGGTTKITLTDSDGNITELTDKVLIDEAMVLGNERLGYQTEGGSRLLSPAYIKILGHHGKGPDTDPVLNGKFIFPDNTTDATRDFILACKSTPDVSSVLLNNDIAFRYRNTKKIWNIRKEKTCTYGNHMGHYKAIMKHDWLSWLFFSKGRNSIQVGVCTYLA